ncbi:hypothetical protein H2202_011295, partial [Exophiala xenobiotica]
ALKKAAATSSLDPNESVRELVAKHEPDDRAASPVLSSSQTEDALSLRPNTEQIQHGENDIARSERSRKFLGSSEPITTGEPLLSVDEDYLGAVQRPVDSAAQILSEAYFHALQGVFGFITREQFLQDLAQFPAQGILLSWDQRRWLALANLVWAIGSKWSHVAKLDDQDLHAKSHLVYYARARALGLDHRVLFDHPNGEGVQAIGLLSFYWFQNGSIS